MNTSNNKKPIVLGLAAICALIVVGAISYSTIRFLTKDASETANTTDTSGTSSATINKTVVTNSTEIPPDLPPSSPLYDDAELVNASTSLVSNGAGKAYTLDFRTSQSQAEVFAYYEDKFSTGGWELNSNNTSGDTHTISATNRGRHLDAILSSPTADETDESSSFQLLLIYMPYNG